ncbi:unnamed protein product [Rotaria sordida]|uniref:Uncharacterized protein n=1 Tax=Rotaria sordida TaxID=392033 RepID=A0A814DUW8_9BILA|nr:unnamed protein product [Rotaria sordida]
MANEQKRPQKPMKDGREEVHKILVLLMLVLLDYQNHPSIYAKECFSLLEQLPLPPAATVPDDAPAK